MRNFSSVPIWCVVASCSWISISFSTFWGVFFFIYAFSWNSPYPMSIIHSFCTFTLAKVLTYSVIVCIIFFSWFISSFSMSLNSWYLAFSAIHYEAKESTFRLSELIISWFIYVWVLLVFISLYWILFSWENCELFQSEQFWIVLIVPINHLLVVLNFIFIPVHFCICLFPLRMPGTLWACLQFFKRCVCILSFLLTRTLWACLHFFLKVYVYFVFSPYMT